MSSKRGCFPPLLLSLLNPIPSYDIIRETLIPGFRIAKELRMDGLCMNVQTELYLYTHRTTGCATLRTVTSCIMRASDGIVKIVPVAGDVSVP